MRYQLLEILQASRQWWRQILVTLEHRKPVLPRRNIFQKPQDQAGSTLRPYQNSLCENDFWSSLDEIISLFFGPCSTNE